MALLITRRCTCASRPISAAEREEVAVLFDTAAADNGCVVSALVAWPTTLTDAQCDLICWASHETYYKRPFDKRDRVESCREAARRIRNGDDFTCRCRS